MNRPLAIALVLTLAASGFAQQPFAAVRRSDVAAGNELSDAFYHAGKNRLFAVDDGSPDDARIVTIDMAFTSLTNPVIMPIYTYQLTRTPPTQEPQVDLEGITFKTSNSADDNTCFLLNENPLSDTVPFSSIIEYDVSTNGAPAGVKRRMAIEPLFEATGGRGPEALTWVPETFLPPQQRPQFGAGYFYLGWEFEAEMSGRNRVWVFRYTDANTNALERAISVPGLTDAHGTFLIDCTPSPDIDPTTGQFPGEAFRAMHFDQTTGRLWALFANQCFPQIVIVSDVYGHDARVYPYDGTDAPNGSYPAWEGIALRPCSPGQSSLYLVSDHAPNANPALACTQSGADNGMVFGFDRCCVPADLNGDGRIDGDDIQPFVAVLFAAGFACPADVNGDGIVTTADVAPFVCLLLGRGVDCQSCSPAAPPGGGGGDGFAGGGGGGAPGFAGGGMATGELARSGPRLAWYAPLIVQWQAQHPRGAYPGLSHRQYRRMLNQYLVDIGVRTAVWLAGWDAYQDWLETNRRVDHPEMTARQYVDYTLDAAAAFGVIRR